MLCPDFLGPNTCTLHYLEVVGVGVGVLMEHASIVQEVCQEGEAEVLKVEGGVALSAITTKFSVLSVSPVSRHMSCAG